MSTTKRSDVKRLLGAASAVWRSGMLRPPGPRAAGRLLSALWTFGPTAALPIAAAAARWPDRIAVVDDHGEISYRDLVETSVRLAEKLRAAHPGPLGRKADCVGVLCRNGRGFVTALIVGCLLGKEVVLINYDLAAKQLGPILGRHGVGLLLHDEEFAEALDSIGHPCLRAVPDAPFSTAPAVPSPAVRKPALGQVGLTLLTSGTTGSPKGVPRAVRPVPGLYAVASAIDALRLRAGQVGAVTSPLFHGLGFAAGLGLLALGDTLIVHRRYTAEQLYQDIEERRVEVIMTVPTILARLLEAANETDRKRDTSSLDLVLSAAAPLPAVVAREFIAEFGPVVVNGYGTTEAGIISLAGKADLVAEPGTVGPPVIGAKVKILRPDRTEAPAGEPGTIFVKGTMVYAGYTPDSSANVKDKEVLGGYVSTGDVGHVDAAGLLYVDGREDDMIVSGGENIFPGEVEDVLLAHPEVADAAVIGVPDQQFGQVLRAFLVLRHPDRRIDPETFKSFLRESLERYKIPKQFSVLAELPRNPSGKILRTQLSALP
ncbi:MAG: AMP-binding protein [Segniliparus sp.]|uniref:AMP-binding protein n=1 Tax=Segniliparus sp. TaxID=2804064 RepID=UPI003F30A73E